MKTTLLYEKAASRHVLNQRRTNFLSLYSVFIISFLFLILSLSVLVVSFLALTYF